MTRILFICLGNICRSPMAEFVMKDMVKRAGTADQFEIASAATSREEVGNPVYPPARQKLAEHGISCKGKTAMTNSAIGLRQILPRQINRILVIVAPYLSVYSLITAQDATP